MPHGRLVRFTADAGKLVAAKGRACRQGIVRIDPHTARFHRFGYPQGPVDITGPDGAAQAVYAVVGHGDDFCFIGKGDDAHDGPEDFFLGNAHIVPDIGKYSRFDEPSLFQPRFRRFPAATDEARSFLLPDFNIIEDFLHLPFVYLGAHLGRFFPGQAYADAAEAVSQIRDELVINAFLDENPRSGAAYLALVEQDAQLGPIHSHIPVAVVKVNIGRFAAQFQRSRNQLLHSRIIDVAADFRRSRKGQLLDIGMIEDILASPRALAGNDVDHARRQDIADEMHQFEDAQGRGTRRLEDDGAACRQGRSQFPYLQAMNDSLNGTPFKIAYRTRNEFLLYVVNNLPYNMDENGNEFSEDEVIATALDEITSMKILSRIEGDDTKVKQSLLEKLITTIETQLLALTGEDKKIESVSIAKLKEMQGRLSSGYTSFWS